MKKQKKVSGLKAIDKRVRVFWEKEDQYFYGTITGYNKNKRDYQVTYDDGEVLWGHLWRDCEFLDDSFPPREHKRRQLSTGNISITSFIS